MFWWDWFDIIDFDYLKLVFCEYMIELMKYWVKEVGIDGYCCDVVGFVFVDFWNNVCCEFDDIKFVLMFVEWELCDLYVEVFDMIYVWLWFEYMCKIVNGYVDVSVLFIYYLWNESVFLIEVYCFVGVVNYDINVWEGIMFEYYGEVFEFVIVLFVVGEGFLMIYNG